VLSISENRSIFSLEYDLNKKWYQAENKMRTELTLGNTKYLSFFEPITYSSFTGITTHCGF